MMLAPRTPLAIALTLATLSATACGTDPYTSPYTEPLPEDANEEDAALASPELTREGHVILGDTRYRSVADFHQSDEFRNSGRRCATAHDVSAAQLPLSNRSAASCGYNYTSINPLYAPDEILEIPVVFHVIQRTDGTGYISDALIRSQVDVLNEDFRALPATPGRNGVDARIQFVLASQAPDGSATNGINYHTNNSWFVDPGYGVTPMKAALAWDPDRYLNIYTNDASGALGYATFPQTSAGDGEDGVVLAWNVVGRNAPQAGMFNQGRTATHEVGHYLGLFHTFQDGCGSASSPYSTGDLIADTVAHRGPDYECKVRSSSCGGGTNPIRNFMNYTPDSCMTGFSEEQVNRMRCSLINFRNELFTTAGNTPALPPDADFTGNVNGLTVSFSDQSSAGDSPITSWLWNFGDGQSSNQSSPTHTYATAGQYTVTLTVTDADGDTNSASATVTVSVSNQPQPSDALIDGEPRTNVSGAAGSQRFYYIDVPEGTENLRIESASGSGDADLYLRFGSRPTESTYDCRPYESGNNEVCSINTPQAGRWYIMLNAYQPYQGLTLSAELTEGAVQSPSPQPTVAELTGLSAGSGQQLRYTIALPQGLHSATFETIGENGDADLYLRLGQAPTTSTFDYRPFRYGSNESITLENPQSGEWHILINAYEGFSGLILRVTYE
ncbi:PKD domain-containing protein [Bradymonadaceae bacterium TMQ3]|nr:PKD domain-containing protein [Bradymonadaceae bacterium TMQ3]TXC74898.1 PKD domain-containing protein [Bradymonadales bacterium TMQ1]